MDTTDRIYEIPIDQIQVSLFNVRRTDANIGIDELAESIKKYGLLQPVILMGKFGKPPYELVVGQRRLLAHQKLKLAKIRAVFYEETDELKLRMLSLSENMHRADLNYADKAESITKVYVAFGKNANKVAKELGLSVQTVLSYVSLEEQATPKAKELLRTRLISKQDVKRAISAAQGNKDIIDKLLIEIPKLTKYEKDRAVEYGKKERASAEKIIEEAKRPKLERTVILTLDDYVNTALTKAGQKLSMDREEIATMALEKWLEENGFLRYVVT